MNLQIFILILCILGTGAAALAFLYTLFITFLCRKCKFCGNPVPRSKKLLIKIPNIGYMCYLCAKERRDYASFRGVDLHKFRHRKEGCPDDAGADDSDATDVGWDDDVGHIRP